MMRTGRWIGVMAALALVSWVPVADAAAQTFTVTGVGDSPATCTDTVCPTLRAAVEAANGAPGSTIQLQAGTFTLTAGSALVVTAPTTITGAGPGGMGGTTIEQTASPGAVVVDSQANGTLALSDVELTGGKDANAAGVFVQHTGVTLALSHDLVTGNISTGQAGSSGSPTGGSLKGGGVDASGPLQMTDTIVSDNHATGGNGNNPRGGSTGNPGGGGDAQGGGIYAAGPTTITGSTITGNTVTGGVGGGSVSGTGDPGGASEGAGVYAASGAPLTISSSTIASNIVTGAAGGIAGDNSQVAAGTAAGGGIYAQDTLTLSDGTLADNQAHGANGFDGFGGAGGAVSGGGIEARGQLSMAREAVTDNVATGGQGAQAGSGHDTGGTGGAATGGGILEVTTAHTAIDASTIAGNTATGGAAGGANGMGTTAGAAGVAEGGGIYRLGSSTGFTGQTSPTVADSTITANNVAGNLAQGGGIGTQGLFSVSLTGDTLSANVGSPANLFAAGSSSFTVLDTVLAAPGGGPSCGGGVTDSGNNLEDSGSGSSTCGLSSARADLLLAPGTDGVAATLADNGGPTQTLALAPSSPALGAGSCAGGPVTDQRGLPRPAVCDIGAFQHQPPAATSAPAISGTAALGHTLSCSPGTFTGDGVSLSISWLRDGAAIVGASGNSYLVQSADVGHSISCSVTAVGTYGHATSDSGAVKVLSPIVIVTVPSPIVIPPPPPVPVLHKQTDTVSRTGVTTVTVSCKGSGVCTGTLSLSLTSAGGKAVAARTTRAKPKRRRVTIGSARFRIAAGHSTHVAVHLSAAGRKLLTAGHGKLRVSITLKHLVSIRTLSQSVKATLKLAPPHKHRRR